MQQQWHETGRRCRGELLLVDNGQTLDPPVSPASQSATAEFSREAIEHARDFTVAIRARRAATSSRAMPFLTAPSRTVGDAGRSYVRGTGTVIDRQGFILTNEHVIHGACGIEVYVSSVGWLPAQTIGSDPQSDLAVIRVKRSMPAACQFADHPDSAIGKPVAAVGSAVPCPENNEPAALTGILTARRRCLQGALDPTQQRFYASLLESTISLPRGYSGGPLVDGDGRVIGINTAAAIDRPTGRRVGYAIPISRRTRSIIARLVRGENVEHGYLGFLARASAAIPATRAPTANPGVVVERVLPDSPAAGAGIRAGDVITRIDGTAVTGAPHLAEQVRSASVGRPISIQLDRGGRFLTLAATPTARAFRPANN